MHLCLSCFYTNIDMFEQFFRSHSNFLPIFPKHSLKNEAHFFCSSWNFLKLLFMVLVEAYDTLYTYFIKMLSFTQFTVIDIFSRPTSWIWRIYEHSYSAMIAKTSVLKLEIIGTYLKRHCLLFYIISSPISSSTDLTRHSPLVLL